MFIILFLFYYFFRDEKIQFKIARIIKIWNKLGLYDDSYLADLTSLLTTPIRKLKLADPVQEFQVSNVLKYSLVII